MLSPDIETFLEDPTGLPPTPFAGHSADYTALAQALRERVERPGEAAAADRELLERMEAMAAKARNHERAQSLLDLLTDPRRREQSLIDEGLCLQCAGMGVDYVSAGLGGRTCVSCSGCGGSGKLKDYKKRLGQA